MPESLTAFLDPLGRLKESREAEKILPPVREILLVTLCGMIAGSGGGEEIEDDGESKRELLRQLLPFAQGIPSDDTRRRFFRSMDPEAFPEIFAAFVREWRPEAAERLIAMDGKTSRRSHDGTVKARSLVSAFATEARMVLAPTATAEKSNEMTAIPELLRRLDLRGATVSIDALGCQREIAQQIAEGGGHSLLGLKGNQGTRHQEVRLLFEQPPPGAVFAAHEEADKGQGRLEVRRCDVTGEVAWLRKTHHGPNLQSIARMTATRVIGNKITTEVRYYLADRAPEPMRLLADTRRHGAMENTLHGTLARSFGEEACRSRKDNAPLAIATIRHVALNLLLAAQQQRESIKRLRKKAGWDDQTLKPILNIS